MMIDSYRLLFAFYEQQLFSFRYRSRRQGFQSQLMKGSERTIDGGVWQYGFLRSRANSIEGGTTEVQKNIIGERVLGLPKG